MSELVLEVTGARKTFGAVNALDFVDFSIGEGEIVALLGDNGAGKSTLIKAISGVHRLDEGEIRVGGEPVDVRSPVEARELGIETVYQDLALFDNLSPAANFYAGRELRGQRWLGMFSLRRDRQMAEEWERHLEALEVRIKDPNQPVGLMSGGQRQAIAVARAVAFAKRLVILDEPTAALGVRESAQVLRLIESLPKHGVSVLLISHNLEQVMQVANRAVVLRQGRRVGEAEPTLDNHQRLVGWIVGAAPDGAFGRSVT
jgi:ABC-type sugar transport system ATPase subunit